MGFLKELWGGSGQSSRDPSSRAKPADLTSLDGGYLKDQYQGMQDRSTQIYGQQQALASALEQQAQGGGPNPAAGMLQQATDQNVKQGAGMVASQRGINPALAARLAAQNTGAAQQQAAQDMAVMRSKQQIAAQQQLAAQQGSMAGASLQGQQLAGNTLSQQNIINQKNKADAAATNAALAMENTKANSGIGGVLLGATGGELQTADPAPVPGDSLKNDIIPAMLSPKEIVLPRSVTLSANPGEKAKQFVEAIKGRASAPVSSPQKPKSEPKEIVEHVSEEQDHQDKVPGFLHALTTSKAQAKENSPKAMPKEGYAKVLFMHKHLDERLKKVEAMAKQLKSRK